MGYRQSRAQPLPGTESSTRRLQAMPMSRAQVAGMAGLLWYVSGQVDLSEEEESWVARWVVMVRRYTDVIVSLERFM